MWNRKQDGGELMGQDTLSDPENQATIEELKVNLIKRQGIIPFVGAGLSAPWFPVWRNFLLESVLAGAARDEVESILASDRVGRFEIAAGAVERILGREAFDRHIYQTFGTALAGDALISDNAVSQLTDLPTGPVITTNYDHVLETVFRMHRKAFDMVLWGARIQLGIDSLMEDQAVLLKLHGDARHPEDRVLTDAEYERHYGPIGVSSFDQWEGTRLLPLILAATFPLPTCPLSGVQFGGRQNPTDPKAMRAATARYPPLCRCPQAQFSRGAESETKFSRNPRHLPDLV